MEYEGNEWKRVCNHLLLTDIVKTTRGGWIRKKILKCRQTLQNLHLCSILFSKCYLFILVWDVTHNDIFSEQKNYIYGIPMYIYLSTTVSVIYCIYVSQVVTKQHNFP